MGSGYSIKGLIDLNDAYIDLKNRMLKLENAQPADESSDPRVEVEKTLRNSGFIGHKALRLRLEQASRKRKEEINA